MIENILTKQIAEILDEIYGDNIYDIQFQKTRKEFEGDITLVVFPFTRFSKKSPEITAKEIGERLIKLSEIKSFNVIKGFLNLEIEDSYWLSQFFKIVDEENFGFVKASEKKPIHLVEYSSPNTNKPIHLGHLRNNFLGYSISEILKASGKKVKKVQIINDRGIHICKSMVAWIDYGNGDTPESTGIKGDHFVGKYYVKFDKQYKEEISELIKNGLEKDEAEKNAPIFLKAQKMLLKWENKDEYVYNLWEKMNSWVYDGFEETYKKIGVDFDKNYYESDTYLLGKKVIEIGLEKNVFFKKNDGSVWIDLTSDGLDEKILLRSDGTAVYMTQDIGTAIQRHEDFGFSDMTYTVGNEQEYHFKVLFLILEKLGYSWAKNCYHLSYGMIDLPSGKMKSREGTVVDADVLVDDMIENSRNISSELGKVHENDIDESNNLYKTIALGALKYFILKVDARKRMLFNPEESIDFNGNTGPFIQYTYARINSILNKNKLELNMSSDISINKKEKDLIKNILEFPKVIQEAAKSFNPSLIANYIFELVKEYNSYYQSTSILKAEADSLVIFRVLLSKRISTNIKSGMSLLGIDVPERM
tara:strand:- start:1012 stop:2778 length:1767 start_codon:yes stop_codon:yes gene_type:complete